MPKQTKASTIQKDLSVLDQIIKKFEDNSVTIEEGIESYEKAAQIIKHIKSELSSLELKINEIHDSIS